jgi:ATP-dependent Clp protease ATP-binding subunit ClpC
VSSDDSARLLGIEETLHGRVIGQHEAITAVSKAIRRARTGLKDPKRPIASLIFAGPTGVGKTELCKALASEYYGNEEALLRFDMSEFMEKHSVSRLMGSPPGYAGYDDGSQLCDRIRRNPYSLVLFDEIEKAHPDVFNVMLQILEDGQLTDSKGRAVSFKNAMIIMTSNVGAQEIEKTIEGGAGFGFQTSTVSAEDATYETLKEVLSGELKSKFKPEFINRLDDTIVFKPLVRKHIGRIADLEFEKVFERVREGRIVLSQGFKEKVLEEGFDPKYGARPLRRAIAKLLEDELATELLMKPLRTGEVVEMDVGEDGKVITKRARDSSDLPTLERALA